LKGLLKPTSPRPRWPVSVHEDRVNATSSTRIAATLTVFLLSLITLYGCQDLGPIDTQSLLFSGFRRSEILGFVAGFGTTFAAVPDLVAMLKRHSSAGMNPRMAAIMGVFQIFWVYYGLLIASRPVIAWNLVAVLINFVSVAAFGYFAHKERAKPVDGIAR
jgi:MtN3 and saliva related transmembrane protein